LGLNHLNDTELDLIDGLVPPGQMLIRKAQTSKKVYLNVDSVSHWMATNNARDNPQEAGIFRPPRV
jgi:type IV secretion system protein VirB4